jgi:hypothetical protein
MFVIDVAKNANEPQWREFSPGVRALLAPWTRTLMWAVRKTVASTEEPAKMDEDRWNVALYRLIVRDIEGIVDPNGAPLPCSDSVKDMICECSPEFLAWAIDESKKLGQLAHTEGEKLIKNLNSSHGGRRKENRA